MEIRDRILKDLGLFSKSLEKANRLQLGAEERKVVGLAAMYAKDSESWLSKGDFYTSFSSIAYAHGLVDAVLKIRGIYDESV